MTPLILKKVKSNQQLLPEALSVHVCVCVCVCKPGSSGGSVIKNPPASAGDSGDAGSIPG